MTDCSCTNFPASLGNVTFGASVGIGTSAPTQLLHISSATAFPGVLIQGTDPTSGVNGFMLASDGRQYNIGVGGSQNPNVADKLFIYDGYAPAFRLVLDPSGNLGLGTTAPLTQLHLASTAAPDSQITAQSLQVETSGYGDNNLNLFRYSDVSWSKARLQFAHARGTKAAPASVQAGDYLGALGFGGWLGGALYPGAAGLEVTVDGAPGASALPGKLDFFTFDGGGTRHDLALTSSGNVGIGTTAPGAQLEVVGSSGLRVVDSTAAGTATGSLIFGNLPDPKFLYAPVDGTLQWKTHAAAGGHSFEIYDKATSAVKVHLDVVGASYFSGGNVGIGTTTPQQALDVAGTVRTTGVLLGGDMLLSGGIKDSTGQFTRVDYQGCYYSS